MGRVLINAFWMTVVILNLIGAVFGLLLYESQLSKTPFLQWIFVPDCPLYVFLFCVLVVLAFMGIRNDDFSLLVSVGCMQYGAWTLFVLLFYREYYFNSALPVLLLQSIILFVMHIGMVLEGFVLPFKTVPGKTIVVVLAWFLLNDIVDYFWLNTHPFLPSKDAVPAMLFVFAATIAFMWIAVTFAKKGWRISIPPVS